MTIRKTLIAAVATATMTWLPPARCGTRQIRRPNNLRQDVQGIRSEAESTTSTLLSEGPLHRREQLQPIQKPLDTTSDDTKSGFENDVLFDHQRGLQECDACGNFGSCGRTTPLGDFFDVTVESTSPGTVWIVSCLHSNRDAPDCYYSPGGETNITEISEDQHFVKTVTGCDDECCTWKYPRFMWTDLPTSNSTLCDGSTNCMEISQVCTLPSASQSKKFSCPVGTMMQIEGGIGDSTLTALQGAIVVSSIANCVPTADGLECPGLPEGDKGFPLSAIVAADDCSCVTCGGTSNSVQEGDCAVPIPAYIPSEGICAPPPESGSNLCGDTASPSVSPTAGATDSPTVRATGSPTGSRTESPTGSPTESPTTGQNEEDRLEDEAAAEAATARREEFDGIMQYWNLVFTANQDLRSAIMDGTLTPSERFDLVSSMVVNLENMQLALLAANVYVSDNQTYVLSLIAGIQTQFPLLECGVAASTCVEEDDLLTVITTVKSLLEQIDMMLEL